MILAWWQSSMDPLSYGGASWGVLGALVFVIGIMGGILYNVFVKGSAAAREREDKLLAFVSSHSDKTADVLRELGEKIERGDSRVANAMDNQARMLQTVLLTWDALQRARIQKAGTGVLTPTEIENIIRAAHEATRRGSG